jgi:hypothetical protein
MDALTDQMDRALADDEPPRTLDIEFADPIIGSNNQRYDGLHLVEPTANQIERAEQELAGQMNVHALRKYQIALVSQCAGVPRDVVGKMKISQVKRASDFLSVFIGGGPQIGGI